MGRKTRQKQQRLEARKLELQKRSQKTNFQIKIPKNILIIISFLAVFLSIAYLALTVFKPGVPSGHDIIAHTYRSKIFIDALKEGQFPVRWINWSLNNFSGPFFSFYQVGFYYLMSVVNLIIPNIYSDLKILLIFSWWLGAVFMFLYSKRFGNLSGALAALVFAFTPYIISDFFVRAAYPEGLAIALSVGILWGMDRILITGNNLYGIPLTICIALLSITHLPTIVILTPVLTAYFFLLLFTKEITWKGFLQFLLAGFLGIGIAGFYLIPSVLELDLIKSSLLTASYYDFRPHFVYPQQLFSTFWDYGISEAGPADGMSFQVGIIQWIIIFASIIVSAFYIFKKKNIAHLIFWLLAILYSLFFIHDISTSFWENIQTIAFIQYPFRYLMVIPLASSILAAILLKEINKDWLKTVVIFVVILATFVLYGNYLKPAVFLTDDYFKISSDYKNSQSYKYSVLEEGYLPKTAELSAKDDIPGFILISGKGKIDQKDIKASYQSFSSTSQEQLTFLLTTHYFPGWKAYIDNMETSIEVSKGYGFMQITIPPGVHKIEFKFTNTPTRAFANFISIFSLIVFILWQIWGNRKLFVDKTHSRS